MEPMLDRYLGAATAAPSVHNTQPWLFRPHRDGIDVYADRDRQLTVIDPDGRELTLSVGAALFNLRLAIMRGGRLAQVRVGPEPDDPDLLVRVVPGGPVRASATVSALAGAVTRRRSNRGPFADLAVPSRVQEELAAAAAAEGAVLVMTGIGGRRVVLRSVADADRYWCADPGYRQELAEWTRPAPGRRDGIAAAAMGPRSDTLPLRDLGLSRPDVPRATATFEAESTIAVLYTADTPSGWLRAGQALQRVLLTATVRGLSASLLTQPLEIGRLRDRLSDPATGRAAQAIIRFGFSRQTPAASARRPLSDVLTTW
jgi:hypothetical protein